MTPVTLAEQPAAWAGEVQEETTSTVSPSMESSASDNEESSRSDNSSRTNGSSFVDNQTVESSKDNSSDSAAESTENDEENPTNESSTNTSEMKAQNSWADITGFNSAYTKYVNELTSRLASACGNATGCKVAGLKDNGVVSVKSGYQGAYSADAAGGIITTSSDTSPQAATTYKFTVRPNHTGKFSIRNAGTVSGTRPSFIIAAHGQFGNNEAQSDYAYAGYLGDQKNGVKFASAGDFSSWLNSASHGDYFLGNKSTTLCAAGRCQGGANSESNWVFFNNGTKSTITVAVVLTARGSGNAAKLTVKYTELNNADAVPVYRLYHRGADRHLYTVNRNEYNTLQRRGWRSEGVSFKASKTGTPVYRLYFGHYHLHLYTANKYEYNSLQKKGWRGEGIAFRYAADGLNDVYRLNNPYTREHIYTSYNEYRLLGLRTKWQQEHIAWSSL
ncbi:hypothetical protein GFD17_01030 [Bifidobacterium sp. SMB2]|uniref:DUF5648 domain-containing protein n=2 Tax=Bifidobacterium TaxID=1678 RepID=A0ABX0CC85_9BIFI|nr:hypothetical protein [Bifidobacterium saimiriisciurei]NEG95361.1 hypothetical protein [Bifidobacterium sp. SMB2]NEH11455.1 hypothetical protein [Bifidobacterium saimiriisciurei]